MEKLSQLRKYLLESHLKLENDQLDVFADEGSLSFSSGEDNQHYQQSYQANVIITDYIGEADALFYFICQFVKSHQPNRKADDITFDVDIIDAKRVDISIIIPFTETIIVTQQSDGINFESLEEPDLEDIVKNITGIQDFSAESQR